MSRYNTVRHSALGYGRNFRSVTLLPSSIRNATPERMDCDLVSTDPNRAIRATRSTTFRDTRATLWYTRTIARKKCFFVAVQWRNRASCSVRSRLLLWDFSPRFPEKTKPYTRRIFTCCANIFLNPVHEIFTSLKLISQFTYYVYNVSTVLFRVFSSCLISPLLLPPKKDYASH